MKTKIKEYLKTIFKYKIEIYLIIVFTLILIWSY